MKNHNINPKTAVRSIRNSIIPATTARGFLLMPLLLVCFALLPAPNVFGVLPAPDGGYPNWNTAEGTDALFNLTTGSYNTAIGGNALHRVTSGGNNTAVGLNALYWNNGDFNTATGLAALFMNTTGAFNTANGAYALNKNTSSYNTATGYEALYNNGTGNRNTATGYHALFSNGTGNDNTATGESALVNNSTGNRNTATGQGALANTNGNDNTALGHGAGFSIITGSGNVCIGAGVNGVAGENDTTRIRNVYASVANGRAVYVNSDNKIGTLSSSRRYKDEIRPLAKASEVILSLRPVSFRYKREVDPTRSLSFGLIAEEVAQVDPDLVTPDRYGKPETVRYEAVNAMLLNEFLKEHKTVQELKSIVARQEAIIARQQKGMEILTAQLKEQAAQIEKVSAQLEMGNPAPKVVANEP
jgi:uncharacterized coiled-coil protein SlyX